MALSPEGMDAAVIRNLAGKTGRDLGAWQSLLLAAGPFVKPAAAVAWLKSEHGLGHVTAQIVVRSLSADETPNVATPDPLSALFGPVGAPERDLLEELIGRLRDAVPEATIGIRKTYVSFSHRVQFMVVTKTPSAPGLTIGLSDQDSSYPPLQSVRGLGGSERIRFRVHLNDESGIATILVHAAAAAKASAAPRSASTRVT